MSQDEKRIFHKGIILGEEKLLQKLKACSKEGWELSRITMMSVYLTRNQPKDVDYLLDIHENKEDKDEYLKNMVKSGWKLAASREEYHYFNGKPGTQSVYSDNYENIKTYDTIRKSNMGIASICSCFLFLICAIALFKPEYFESAYGAVYIIVTIMLVLFFLSSIIKSLNYERRIKRIKERTGKKVQDR